MGQRARGGDGQSRPHHECKDVDALHTAGTPRGLLQPLKSTGQWVRRGGWGVVWVCIHGVALKGACRQRGGFIGAGVVARKMVVGVCNARKDI